LRGSGGADGAVGAGPNGAVAQPLVIAATAIAQATMRTSIRCAIGCMMRVALTNDRADR
jgi:hypothetical protein